MAGAIISMQEFREDMVKLEPQFQLALPPTWDAGRMARMCVTVVQQNPGLLNCTKQSLYGAFMTAAQLGLYPDVSVLGHAYFIPFRNHKTGRTDCTFIAGYKGLIDLARRSGAVTSISAYPVHQGDDFDFAYGTQPFIKHKPSGDPIEERELTHVYAMATIRGEGRPQFIVMTREEVEAIRKRSPGKNLGPWVDHYEQMALKTAIRRLCKYLPLSSQLQRAVALDEAADSGIDQKLETAVNIAALDDSYIDAEVVEEIKDEVGTIDELDELVDGIKSANNEPNEYEKLCINGMGVFGDAEWRTKLAEIKKDIATQKKSPNEAEKALIASIKRAIKERG